MVGGVVSGEEAVVEPLIERSGGDANLYYDPEADVIVFSLANSYAVPADCARKFALKHMLDLLWTQSL